MFAVLLAAQDVPDERLVERSAGVLSTYRDCVDRGLQTLDDGKQTVEVVTRAAMFACGNEHDALRASYEQVMRDILKRHVQLMSAPKIQKQIDAELEAVDSTVRDRSAYLIIRNRQGK